MIESNTMEMEPGRAVGETVQNFGSHPLLFNIDSHIWPLFNETGKPIVLDTYHPDPKKVRHKIIKPGERIILPKQVQFVLAAEKYLATLFAGAAGPGKSWILRWLLIRIVVKWSIPKEQGGLGVTGAQVGLFCNTYKELKDRHINEFKKIDPEIGIFVGGEDNEFRLSARYGNGRILCRNLEDPIKYSSTEFSAIAIDEATLISEPTFNFLMTRLRPNVRGIEHSPVLLASNPGGPGHSWVYRRFVNPETRDKPVFDSVIDYWTKGHYFIPALPKDNPFLTKQYRATLRTLPDKLRRALDEGDWSVFAGQYFRLDPNIHWIAEFKIPPSWNRIRVIDHGGNHPTVCLWMACSPDNKIYIYRELSMANISALEFKKLVAMHSIDEDGYPETYRMTIGDPSMKGSGKWSSDGTTPWTIYNDMQDGIGSFFMVEGNRDRVPGWHALQSAFDFELEEGGDLYKMDEEGRPLIKFKKEPKLYVFRNCIYTWNSLTVVTYDETKNVEDVRKTKGTYGPGEGDDESDCVRMGYVMISPGSVERSPGAAKPKKRPKSEFDLMKNNYSRNQYPFANF